MKNTINTFQPKLSGVLKRKPKEHYKAYIHRLFLNKNKIKNLSSFRNEIADYEGYFVLQNAHKERLHRLFKKQSPKYSFKRFEKILN